MASVQSGSETGETEYSSDMDGISEHVEYCACQNEGHQNLAEWYDDYRDDISYAFEEYDELLDNREVEEEIQALMPNINVHQDYCVKCQGLLDTWLETIRNVLVQERSQWYQRPHFSSVLEFDASQRNGCQLCMLFAQCIIRRGCTLEIFHKIQRRLKCLGKASEISVTIEYDDDDCKCYRLNLTWPGHDSPTNLPADPLYVTSPNAASCTYVLSIFNTRMKT